MPQIRSLSTVALGFAIAASMARAQRVGYRRGQSPPEIDARRARRARRGQE